MGFTHSNDCCVIVNLLALVVELEDRDALQVYLKNDAHFKVVRTQILPNIEDGTIHKIFTLKVASWLLISRYNVSK
jgi:hypothetical protein